MVINNNNTNKTGIILYIISISYKYIGPQLQKQPRKINSIKFKMYPSVNGNVNKLCDRKKKGQ